MREEFCSELLDITDGPGRAETVLPYDVSVAVAMIRLEELGRGTKRERTSGHEVPQIQAERSHLSQSGMLVLVVKWGGVRGPLS